MNWPRAVGIMPTRNRPEMAHRSVHLFLEQTYEGEKHLLVFDDGDVGIDACEDCIGRFELVNPKLDTCLPRKRNAMMRHVDDQEAVYFLWDDDDYHGPDRIRRQVPVVVNFPICIMRPTLYYSSIENDLRMSRWLSDATAAYTWEYWRRIGGFNERIDPGSGLAFCKPPRNVGEVMEIPGAYDYMVVVHRGQRHSPPGFGPPDFTEAPVPASWAQERLQLR